MPTLRFEGRQIASEPGDTVASALFRAGVRVFTRSFKYHRPRGLYCLSGDCPNCLVTVDGIPGVRACVTPAEGQVVRRERGRPSVDRDVLSALGLVRRLMPVGFYYKTFVRPRWAWRVAERVIVRATGIGDLPLERRPERADAEHVHPDVLVVGGGVAGLAAARAAADAGSSVLVCEELSIGQRTSGALRERIERQAQETAAHGVDVRERATAVGIYPGPVVPVTTLDGLLVAHPRRVIVATGALDRHEVFDGNDLPGVWQSRGAWLLVERHGLLPGEDVVVAGDGDDALRVSAALRSRGARVTRVLEHAGDAPSADEPPAIVGRVERALGRRSVRAVAIRTSGGLRVVRCDALFTVGALDGRDALLRMTDEAAVVGAGEVLDPGCDVDAAIASGIRAATEGAHAVTSERLPRVPTAGVVCLCEDVSVHDVERAVEEGFGSAELLKRYTTASMGPCQGAQCGRYVACMSTATNGHHPSRTTARPPARPVALEQIAGVVREGMLRRTALHAEHLALGARMGPSAGWERPLNYGDAVTEYRAVRERVSLMDVSTLGKFLIGGPDAARFVDYVVPNRTRSLAVGTGRYVLLLDDGGYVMDDGVLVRREDGCFALTTTSGGAERTASWLEHLIDRWHGDVDVVDLTTAVGAVTVAGPSARTLLERVTDDPVDAGTFPYMSERTITVCGVTCRAIRVGFVGELSYELHHEREAGPRLWSGLLEAGRDLDVVPHGLDALDVLRLEKGHVYIGQDTLPDDTPSKIGLGRSVDLTKGDFAGRAGLIRLDARPPARSLSGLMFDDADPRELDGVPITRGPDVVGRVTSCERSIALDRTIGLGWITVDGRDDRSGLRAGNVDVEPFDVPFFDREGVRVRG